MSKYSGNLLDSKVDKEIVIEFFEGSSYFDNDSVRICNVSFYIGENANGGRDCLNGAIVNSARKRTWFEFYFDEIKAIYDSEGNILWKHS